MSAPTLPVISPVHAAESESHTERSSPPSAHELDVERVRKDFPILSREINGHPLTYLDNAATTQKPRCVIDAVSDFYGNENANIHRGVHYLSLHATDAYDRARERIARALNAAQPREIIFVRGATEGLNLIASSLGERLSAGDRILLTTLEHHANIVPWQLLALRKGLEILVAPITDSGEICMESFSRLLEKDRIRVVAFGQVSNALGTVNPVSELTRRAQEAGAWVVVDGAQGVPHYPVDVQAINCDFYVFSGHKVFGPDGIGVLYGREEILGDLPPYQSGGDMIERVSMEGTTFRGLPERFEAGTPNISGAIGLATAFDYLESLGWGAIHRHELRLLNYATGQLQTVEGIRLVGTPTERAGAISFVMDGAHPHDIGTILDSTGIAIRAGHHCTQPLMHHLGIAGTARASFAFYNTLEEVDRLLEGIQKVRKYFG